MLVWQVMLKSLSWNVSMTLWHSPGFEPRRVSYFLFVPLRTFFLCYPGEALEGPISTGISNKLKNIDSNNGILISQKILY